MSAPLTQDKCEMIINGKLIDLFNLKDTADLSIKNIVPALHNIIRFNGYSGYSVAQHSVVLAELLRSICQRMKDKDLFDYYVTQSVLPKNPSNAIRYALIHDFSESLTGDIIRPLKQLFPEIRQFETRIQEQICHYHNVDLNDAISLDFVDIFDKAIATIEAYYFTYNTNKTLIDVTNPKQVKLFNDVLQREEFVMLMAECGITFFKEHSCELDSLPIPAQVIKQVFDLVTFPSEIYSETQHYVKPLGFLNPITFREKISSSAVLALFLGLLNHI